MDTNSEIKRWVAEEGARQKEFQLAMTGNPRVGAFVDHDMLAVLVLLAKRSLAYYDYPYEFAEGMRATVEAALSLTDERAHEYIENATADHHALVERVTAEEKARAVPTAQHS